MGLPARQSEITEQDRIKALVHAIAADIGKEVAHHIETMYPDAVTATSRNMLRSVQGCVHNEIIAAIQVNDEGQIIARLKERKAFRREMKAAWKRIREIT